MFSVQDSQYMAEALRLAAQGLFTTTPNPRVGCVLVRDSSIVGSGWHLRAGEAHAEVLALRAAGEQALQATAYVTLEPCSHYGRTPPCADALIAAGIKRVVVAMQDPNPKVAGAGIAKLRAAGIQVEVGLMEAEACALNLGFVSRMTRGLPWVRSKIASSLDGRTALHNGMSQWITGPAARRDVQHWRARSCAVLTGINTILADDARLNVREIDTLRQPLRVVLDTQLCIAPHARVLQGGNVLIYTSVEHTEKTAQLEQLGATVCVVPEHNGRVDLFAAMQDLANRGINEVLVEAGVTLNGALFQARLIDELVLYLAPQLLGDQARGIAHLGVLTHLNQRINLSWQDVRQVGQDVRITARVK